MNVTININRDTDPTELSAVIAFCLALGGKAPDERIIVDMAAPTITPPAPRPTNPVADALLETHAASVAARTAPPPPPAEPAGTAGDPKQLDKDGVPWDERIHSGTPTMNADGTWRKKRGVDEVYFGQIHGELQAAHAAPNGGTAPIPPAPPPPASPAPTVSAPPPPPVDGPNGPTPTVAPPAPTAEAPAAATPAESASGAGRFPDFPSFVQAVSAIRSPAIPYAELNATATQVAGPGVEFKDLRNRPDVWDMFFMMSGGQ